MLLALAAVLLLLILGGIAWFVFGRNSNTPDGQQNPPITSYNEAENFEAIDTKIAEGKCEEVNEDIARKTKSDNKLEKALAQMRQGECLIAGAQYKQAVGPLEASVKTLEELHYNDKILKARSLRDRAISESQIQDDMNRELTPNQNLQGPFL